MEQRCGFGRREHSLPSLWDSYQQLRTVTISPFPQSSPSNKWIYAVKPRFSWFLIILTGLFRMFSIWFETFSKSNSQNSKMYFIHRLSMKRYFFIVWSIFDMLTEEKPYSFICRRIPQKTAVQKPHSCQQKLCCYFMRTKAEVIHNI